MTESNEGHSFQRGRNGKGTNIGSVFMEGPCGIALSPILSSKLWLKLFRCTSSDFHPAESAVPTGGKRRYHAHIDSPATSPERILALYALEFGWPTIKSLPLHKRRHPME